MTAAPTPANEDGPYGHLPFFGVVVGILNTANVGFTARGIISEARIGSILRLVGYTFDLEEILDDLIAARQRGVIVQVMLDKEESSHGSASAAGQFQQVRAMMVEGIKVHLYRGDTLDPPGRHMEPRSFSRQRAKGVWSECRALIGSADWTSDSRRHLHLAVELRINGRGWAQLDAWWGDERFSELQLDEVNLPHSQAQGSRALAVRPQARGQGRASAAPKRAPVQNSRGHRQSGRQPGDVVFYTDDLAVRHEEQNRGAENRARQLSFDEWRSPASAAFAGAMAETPHLPPHQRSSAAAGSGEIAGPPARPWVPNDQFAHDADEANWPARTLSVPAVPWRIKRSRCLGRNGDQPACHWRSAGFWSYQDSGWPSCSLGHERSLLAGRVGLDRGQHGSGSRQERGSAV